VRREEAGVTEQERAGAGPIGGRFVWEALIDLALAEDIGGGDITSAATIPAMMQAEGTLLAKAPGVISGLEAAAAVFTRVDPAVRFIPLVNDGDRVAPMAPIATVSGPARSLLAAERVALNLLQRLSGVATETACYVDAVVGTRARVVDTRKTTPGLRALEKAAVRHGGGANHRFGLTDGVLIKDNHLAAVGGPDRVTRAVTTARAGAPHTLKIEVEVSTLDELAEALEAGADIVMLDNMDVPTMRKAVAMTAGRALLEASGGITLGTIGEIAATGVDLISVGALTHSAPALDISLDFALSPAC
jgi:nicotinate-nucleotide pyrophosphorylase (carboxylating)